jgi:hypothetical protein
MQFGKRLWQRVIVRVLASFLPLKMRVQEKKQFALTALLYV